MLFASFWVLMAAIFAAVIWLPAPARPPWLSACLYASVTHGAELPDAQRRCDALWQAMGAAQ